MTKADAGGKIPAERSFCDEWEDEDDDCFLDLQMDEQSMEAAEFRAPCVEPVRALLERTHEPS